MYHGGSSKDEMIKDPPLTGNSIPSPVFSIQNQIFISFITNGNGNGIGFTAKITFGNVINKSKFKLCIILH